jgi:hypothetical protein
MSRPLRGFGSPGWQLYGWCNYRIMASYDTLGLAPVQVRWSFAPAPRRAFPTMEVRAKAQREAGAKA